VALLDVYQRRAAPELKEIRVSNFGHFQVGAAPKRVELPYAISGNGQYGEWLRLEQAHSIKHFWWKKKSLFPRRP